MSSFRNAPIDQVLERAIKPKETYWQTTITMGLRRRKTRLSISKDVCATRLAVERALPVIQKAACKARLIVWANFRTPPATRRVCPHPWPTVELDGLQAQVLPCSLNHFVVTKV